MATLPKSVANDSQIGFERGVLLLLENLIWPILVIAFVLFSLLIPQIFSSLQNIQFILYSSAAMGMLVLAESICLLSGNFDLSVSAIAGFSAMFTGLILTKWLPGLPPEVGIVLIVLVGGTIGLMNGISVAVIGINPFLQTLAFFIIFSELMPVLSNFSVTGLSSSYLYPGGGTIGPVPVAIFILLGLYLLTWLWLRYTSFGLSIFAVGGNETSAAEAGINTTRVVITVFVISGMLSGLSGLLFTGYVGVVTTSLASGQLFPAFAAAVIGGISLYGGRGSIFGALGGVLLLSTIQTGLVMVQVDSKVVKVINGVLLLAAVLIYTLESRLRGRLLSS